MGISDMEHATSIELRKLSDRITAVSSEIGETAGDVQRLHQRVDVLERLVARQAFRLDRQAAQLGKIRNLSSLPPHHPAKPAGLNISRR